MRKGKAMIMAMNPGDLNKDGMGVNHLNLEVKKYGDSSMKRSERDTSKRSLSEEINIRRKKKY